MKQTQGYLSGLISIETQGEKPVFTACTMRDYDFKTLLATPNLASRRVIRMRQVHGTAIGWVDDLTDTDFEVDGYGHYTVPNRDALITTRKDVVLTVKSADCLPILIYHPKGIVSGIHAGRKGIELGIVARVLQVLKTKYGVDSGFYIWFGPSICADCYQIDRERDLHYDLIGNSTRQLKSILKESDYHLRIASFCTVCHNELFFSYRKEGAAVGRTISLIALI